MIYRSIIHIKKYKEQDEHDIVFRKELILII